MAQKGRQPNIDGFTQSSASSSAGHRCGAAAAPRGGEGADQQQRPRTVEMARERTAEQHRFKAWGCKDGDPMVRPEALRARDLWPSPACESKEGGSRDRGLLFCGDAARDFARQFQQPWAEHRCSPPRPPLPRKTAMNRRLLFLIREAAQGPPVSLGFLGITRANPPTQASHAGWLAEVPVIRGLPINGFRRDSRSIIAGR